MFKPTTELYQTDGNIRIDTRITLEYSTQIHPLSWIKLDSSQRRLAVTERAGIEFTRAILQKHLESLKTAYLETRERVHKALGPKNQFTDAMHSGADLALNMLGNMIFSVAPNVNIFEDSKVETLQQRSDTKFPWKRSRAPYSYEFEQAPWPAPPVVPDPYWCGVISKCKPNKENDQ